MAGHWYRYIHAQARMFPAPVLSLFIRYQEVSVSHTMRNLIVFIALLLFTASCKKEDDLAPQKETGDLIFWTKQDDVGLSTDNTYGNIIGVYLFGNSDDYDIIVDSYKKNPGCGDPLSAIFSDLIPDTYYYYAEDMYGQSWEGDIIIKADNCTSIELN